MKKLIWLIAVAYSLQLSLTPCTHAVDVIGISTRIYIEKTKNDRLTFKLCNHAIRKCEILGKTSGYTTQELQNQKVEEQLEAAGVSIIAVGALVLSVGVAYLAGTPAIAAGVASGASIGPAIATSVGAVVSSIALYSSVGTGIKQFRQTQVLRDEIIFDKDFSKSDEEVIQIAEDLKSVLEKI